MRQELFWWIQKRERHLSALAMVAGFIADSIIFTRVDLVQTQAILAAYALTCFVSIPALHAIEARRERTGRPVRFVVFFQLATQFALGGLWSALLIFYGRAADFGTSWPFLIVLALVFLGSEYFSRYHSRLLFTSILFFFAVYSCAIFILPIYTHTIGVLTFLASGVTAIIIFALFTAVLRVLARQRFSEVVWRVRMGALAVLLIINTFYFTNVLPPLPLSATAAGVYHRVERVPGAYVGTTEADQPWGARYLGLAPTLHLTEGATVFAYSSVFAPTDLVTSVVHRWQWYDSVTKTWVTRSSVAYSIVGGRDGGYRGYTLLPISDAGEWRVNIETTDGRRIARLLFTVEIVSIEPALETVTLK